MLEDDERFKVVEREKDRRNIFDDHISDLKQKVLYGVFIIDFCVVRKVIAFFVYPSLVCKYACTFDISFPPQNSHHVWSFETS